jgi:hypothetical protein
VQADPRYWFAAKRYGWGWGRPIAWQGWLVFAAFILLLAAGAVLFTSSRKPGEFLAYIAVLCAALFGVCYLKGAPLRWRWGEDK